MSSIEIPSVPGSYWVSNTTADATNQLESRFPCVYINNKSSLDWLHQQQQRCTLSALCIFQLSSLSLFLSVWTSSKCVIQQMETCFRSFILPKFISFFCFIFFSLYFARVTNFTLGNLLCGYLRIYVAKELGDPKKTNKKMRLDPHFSYMLGICLFFS